MKITFDDKSYITCYVSDDPNKIVVAISATNSTDNLKKITNSVELTREEFYKLVSDIK